MSKRRKKLDEIITGGYYETADGQLVNANGDFIDEAGNVIACRLPENKPIKSFTIPKHKPFRRVETKETVKIVDGHRLKKLEDFLVKKDWINNESATKEANKIFLEITSKYLSEIKKAKSDKKIEVINKKIEKEYKKRLHNWLYPEETNKGRPLDSQNKNSKINRKDLKKHFWNLHEDNENIKQKDVAKKLEVNERTLRNYIRDRFKMKWKQFCEQLIRGEIEI